MLYVGAVLLSDQNIISQEKYQCFLCFSTAMKILLSDKQAHNMGNVKILMRKFIGLCIDQYGKDFASYNIHAMEHLDEDYLRFGNLHDISAFSFESFLGTEVKGAVRAGFKPLKQVCKSLNNHNLKDFRPVIKGEIVSGKVSCSHSDVQGSCHRTTTLECGSMCRVATETSSKDSCVITTGGHVFIVYGIHFSDK